MKKERTISVRENNIIRWRNENATRKRSLPTLEPKKNTLTSLPAVKEIIERLILNIFIKITCASISILLVFFSRCKNPQVLKSSMNDSLCKSE
jgi:hypothetical protein